MPLGAIREIRIGVAEDEQRLGFSSSPSRGLTASQRLNCAAARQLGVGASSSSARPPSGSA